MKIKKSSVYFLFHIYNIEFVLRHKADNIPHILY